MFTSIAILVGLAIASFFLFVVLAIAGAMLLKGKKPAKPGKTEPAVQSWLKVESPVQLSYREQINIEKAEAVAKLYSDLTEKKFIDETIADALQMFGTASPTSK